MFIWPILEYTWLPATLKLCTLQLEVMSKILDNQSELMELLHDTNTFSLYNHLNSSLGPQRDVVLTPSLTQKSQDSNLLAKLGSSTSPWTN